MAESWLLARRVQRQNRLTYSTWTGSGRGLGLCSREMDIEHWKFAPESTPTLTFRHWLGRVESTPGRVRLQMVDVSGVSRGPARGLGAS